ncbi:MAG: XcyI family restriction endonuclease [Clostridiales Family XIII bacterium]|jgi:hypothetical protein|nr:XcyI family restriction endonuclease [Clostridiales Family XIII bacterium]
MIILPPPETQIEFAFLLAEIRRRMLAEALRDCVGKVDLDTLDSQLHHFAGTTPLKRLARPGLRGELLFSVPCVLENNPVLLGYYRLLLGYSKKTFYDGDSGVGKFKAMEENGSLSDTQKDSLPQLCEALCEYAAILLDGLSDNMLNRDFLDDLALLTLGPQLRGGANVRRGIGVTNRVFEIIQNIMRDSIVCSSKNSMEIVNSSNRKVFIHFANDPDIIVREELRIGTYRNIIAIEIKGGRDFSNIHNRIGEAEKSHQKARLAGYAECWTVVNVDRLDMKTAGTESPSTNKFFLMSDLANPMSDGYRDFCDSITACAGVKTPAGTFP